VRTLCGQGVLQMRTSELFYARNFRFFEIYGVFTRHKSKYKIMPNQVNYTTELSSVTIYSL